MTTFLDQIQRVLDRFNERQFLSGRSPLSAGEQGVLKTLLLEWVNGIVDDATPTPGLADEVQSAAIEEAVALRLFLMAYMDHLRVDTISVPTDRIDEVQGMVEQLKFESHHGQMFMKLITKDHGK